MRHSTDTRRLIIEDMQRLMIRDGLRAVRVNELASNLSISKRTLYELFPDKVSLIEQSLTALFGGWEEAVRTRLGELATAYERLVWLVGEFVRQLNVMGVRMLRELQGTGDSHAAYVLWMEEWRREFSDQLCAGVAEGDCIVEMDTGAVTRGLLMSLFTARLHGVSRGEQYAFGCTILRGISTPEGAARLEQLREPMD